jgi:hypothetical protein
VIGCETMHSIWPRSLQCRYFKAKSYDLCIDRSTDLMSPTKPQQFTAGETWSLIAQTAGDWTTDITWHLSATVLIDYFCRLHGVVGSQSRNMPTKTNAWQLRLIYALSGST